MHYVKFVFIAQLVIRSGERETAGHC